MGRKLLALVAFVCLSVAGVSAQSLVIHGNGDPRTLTPVPNCAAARFYVDDSTQLLYQAIEGSPCFWEGPAPYTTLSNSTATPVTGFTAEAPVCSLALPANVLSNTADARRSRIHYHATLTTSGSGGSDTLFAGTTASSSGVPGHTITAAAATTVGRIYVVDLFCGSRGGAAGYCDGSIVQTSTVVDGRSDFTTTFDPTQPIYFKVSASQTVGTDTVTCNGNQWSVY